MSQPCRMGNAGNSAMAGDASAIYGRVSFGSEEREIYRKFPIHSPEIAWNLGVDTSFGYIYS